MAGARAAIRYAKAMLDLAKDQNLTETLNNDMMLIADTIAENRELAVMLESPVIRSSVKKAALKEIFRDSNQLTTSLFDTLIQNKRIAILGGVAEKYNQLYDELRGSEIATVTTCLLYTSDAADE